MTEYRYKTFGANGTIKLTENHVTTNNRQSKHYQFSIKTVLSVLTIIAVPIALYYSNRTEVSVIRPAVACIDSPPHDYVLAHKELLNYLDSQKFVRIENPGWQQSMAACN